MGDADMVGVFGWHGGAEEFVQLLLLNILNGLLNVSNFLIRSSSDSPFKFLRRCMSNGTKVAFLSLFSEAV